MNNITPYRTYPIQVEKNQLGESIIRAKTTGRVKQVQKAIYMFKNEKTGKCLVGATKNLRKRVNNYNSDINRRIKFNDFFKDIRKKPNNFTFSILEKVAVSTNLWDREKYFIKELDSFKTGYNKNRGGGGAFAKAQIEEEIEYPVPAFLTPEKKYPLKRNNNGGLTIDFNNTPTKTKKRLIYSIYEENPLEASPSKRRKHQIGLTTQNFSKRMSQHMHIVNNEEHLEATRAFYERVRENPENFKVAIMHEARPGENLANLEKQAIACKKLVFNCNKGGGGISKL